MQPKRKLMRAVIIIVSGCILLALAASLVKPKLIVPGATTKKNVTARIIVFEDLNGDGRQNNNEGPLANALIIAHSNIHGTFTRQTRLSDARGQATLTVTYTHYFDVGVLTPCGYIATTPTSLSVAEARPFTKQRFGFQPQGQSLPQTSNSLHFRLWHDVNGDGLQQADEPPLPGIDLPLDPRVEFTYHPNYYDHDALTLTTDDSGQAGIELGTACGTMWVQPPPDWLTTAIPPAVQTDEDVFGFAYGSGLTEISWGLQPKHPTRTPTPIVRRFAFSSGGAYHPEGLGEWQLNLEADGTFSGHHDLLGDITPFGPVTLNDKTNQELWTLIEAADIPGLPPTFQRPGLPDEVAYTFVLTQGGSTYTVEMWVDDARQNEDLVTLVRKLEILRDTYGLAPPPAVTPLS